MIYFLTVIAFLILTYVYDYRRCEKGKLLWWIVMLVVLILISGMRYKMGTDSIKYENYYNWMHSITELKPADFQNTRFAPLYIILSSLCRTISSDFILLQFVLAIIVNTTIFYFLWNNSRHPYMAALLYLFFLYINLNMEVLRESLAVSVFLWSWPSFYKRKWIKYYMYCVLGFFFHISSLVMIFLPMLQIPFIKRLLLPGMHTLIMVPLILIGSFVANYYFFDIIQLIAITDNMANRAEFYSGTRLSGNTLNILGSLMLMFKYAIYPLVALYFLRKLKADSSPKMEQIQVMTMVSLYVGLVTIGITMFLRFNNYFLFFPFVVISDWTYSYLTFKKKLVRFSFVQWIIILLPLFGCQFMTYMANYNKSGSLKVYNMYYPYSNRLDEDVSRERQKAIQYSRNL